MTVPNSDEHGSDTQNVVERSVSRRNVLRTGALASGTLVLGGAPGQAAARQLRRGDSRTPVRLIDSEDPDPDPVIAIKDPGVPIDDWIVFANETVADHNPTYDPEDRVIVVVFERRLNSGWPGWRRVDPDTRFDGVVERGIKFHAFPRTRLEERHPAGRSSNR